MRAKKDAEHFISTSKHKKLKLVHRILAEKIGEEKAADIFRNADKIYAGLVKEWSHIPKAERQHTENFMFPNIALYRAMQEYVSAQEAEQILRQSTLEYMGRFGEKLDKITRIPGFAALFMKVFAKAVDSVFGEKQGFKSKWYVKNKNELSFDILECPYKKYYALIGCPELCQYNCLGDDAGYGHMKKVKFVRAKTLGRGADCCDFRFTRVKNKSPLLTGNKK